MKKLVLLSLIVGITALWFGGLHASVSRNHAATARITQELDASTTQLAQALKQAATLRGEMLTKKNHLRLATHHPNITPELLRLLESDFANGSPSAWAQLRRELDLGWNASPEYVLVNKRILKDVTYDKFWNASEATDTTCDLLSLSRQEKSALNAALKQLRDNWQGSTLTRTEPSGDIVAQYTLAAPDAAALQSLSNNFGASLAAAVGSERANLLLPWGWNEFKNQVSVNETETMIIRQTTVNGEPDLTYQIQRGPNGSGGGSSGPVRYANYPTSWFFIYFPGGWDDLAKREGFQFPAAFHKRQ